MHIARTCIRGLEICRSFYVFLGVALVLAASAQAAPLLDFENILIDGGSLSYSGSPGGTLKGTNILFDRITGLDTAANNGVALNCTGCKLNFETGAIALTTVLSSTSTQYQWNGGGFFKLTGTAKNSSNTTIAAGTLLEGSWDAYVMGSRTGSLFNVIGTGSNTLHTGLLSFFDLPGAPFIFANSELSGSFKKVGTGFTSVVTEADLTSVGPEPVPEPATVLLFGTGLIGVLGYGWRRTRQVEA